MPLEEPTFEWDETADAVTVRLPAPPPKSPAMSWTTAVLAAVAVLILPLTVMLLWRAIAEAPGDATFWWIFIMVMIGHGCLLWVAIARARREARAPGTPSEPSVLAIAGGLLKIERAGSDRGMDYSWELAEIADVRLCNAAPDRIFLSAKSLLAEALVHDEVIRVSIERRSGEVDDITVLCAGRHWVDALETRLRAHLGLRPDATRLSEMPERGH